MLKFIFCFLFASSCWAQNFKYTLEITPEKYKLVIDMHFQNAVLLGDAIKDFKNGALLVGVSDSIKSVHYNSPLADDYVQVMKVRSFGISSVLVSNCKENFQANYWSRECELQTNQEDGGKYMVWKKDLLRCATEATHVHCQADIQGQSKEISIFGFVLASPQNFSLRAKIPALSNFAQIWWAVNKTTLNFQEIRETFKKSELKNEIDNMLDEGLRALKSQPSFQFSAEYKEPLS